VRYSRRVPMFTLCGRTTAAPAGLAGFPLRGGFRKGIPRAARDYRPLTAEVLAAHSSGKMPVGLYPLLDGDRRWWLAADFEGPDAMIDALTNVKACALARAAMQKRTACHPHTRPVVGVAKVTLRAQTGWRPLPFRSRLEMLAAIMSWNIAYCRSLSRVTGRSRTRMPVAWCTALAIAAAVPTMPSSPMPLEPIGLVYGSAASSQ
jgi:hypothetical protein